jgi:HEAT repeat protein
MMRFTRIIGVGAALLGALACTSGPRAGETRARLDDRDLPGAVAAYRGWREKTGADDRGALRALALQTLYQATRQGPPEARRLAIEASYALDLAEMAHPVEKLLDDDDDVVRAAAAAVLLRSHPDAGMVLAESLASGEPEARIIAVSALGERIGKRAHDDIARLTADPDPRVRAAACGALARASTSVAADGRRLGELATGDKEGVVRAAALRALAKIDPGAALAPARTLLGDTYLGARLAAVEALGAAENAGRADLERAAGGDDAFVALRAGVLLARAGARAPGLAAVDRAMASPEWTVRAAAANALSSIGKKDEAMPRLATLAADPETAVRMAAARAYILVGSADDARELLVAALGVQDDDVRLEAAIDLARLSDVRGPKTLDELMTGAKAPAIRARAAAALRIGRGEVTDALLALLLDPSWDVRVNAAWTILALA